MLECPEKSSPLFSPLDISGKLRQVNGRLKASQVRVRVEPKGETLTLRATLPPKPNSDRTEPYQQRVYVGLPCNPSGLREAEKLARLLGAQVVAKEFSWDEWGSGRSSPARSCGEVVKAFKAHYLDNGGNVDTWEGDYQKAFKKLPLDGELHPDILETLVRATTPNTRPRQRVVNACNALAKFTDQQWDGSHLRGNYSPSKVEPRDLPTDADIARYRDQLTNPAWRWVYGMMATYGLRNHEVFHLDLADFPVVRVLEDTKTGSLEVWPCYPEWAEKWELNTRQLPPVKLDRQNSKIGHSVTKYLSPKLPFLPYDLRHAWAVRTLLFGWPVELSARQMGHSVEVHTRTYQRWITRDQIGKVYELLVNWSDRPLPPG
jgi:integrase